MSVKTKRSPEQAWAEGLSALQAFKAREGHCLVPRHHVEGTYKLGQWVAVQRYFEATIAPARRARLNESGFVWSWRDVLWEKGFAALTTFKVREGHCRVPANHIEGDLKLGHWVSTQRKKKINRLTRERSRRLKQIGFAWHVMVRAKKRTSQPHVYIDQVPYGFGLGF